VSQFGITPFGDEGPFGGPGLLTILAMVPAAQNRLVLFFDGLPLADDPKGSRSATNPRNYTVEAVDPTIPANPPYVPEGKLVPTRRVALARARADLEDKTQIHLWLDRDMEGGILHRVTVVGMLHGAACEDFAGENVWEAYAPFSPALRVAPDRLDVRFRDLDDGNLPGFEVLPGVWRYKSNGDIALQAELEAFKKRLIRRLTQQRRSFTWSPNGINIVIGESLTPGVLSALANNVAAMARADSLTKSAGCTVSARTIGNDVYVEVIVTVELLDGREYLLSLSIPASK
jgi:hypothetical protein